MTISDRSEFALRSGARLSIQVRFERFNFKILKDGKIQERRRQGLQELGGNVCSNARIL